MWNTLANIILDRPRLVLLGLALLVAISVPALLNPSINISLEAFVSEEDKVRFKYNEFIQAFGNDNDVLVMIQTDRPFSTETLKRIKELESFTSQYSFVAANFSLLHVFDTERESRQQPLGALEPIVQELPAAQEDLQRLASVVRTSDFYRRSLLSENENLTTVYVSFASGSEETLGPFVSRLQEKAKTIFGHDKVFFAGWPFIKREMELAVRKDLMLIAPAIALVSFLFMWLSFRNIKVILITGTSVLVVILLTLGAFFALGNQLHMATAMLPTLIIAISFAQAIFIISQYFRESGSVRNNTGQMIKKAGPPVFLGAMTTAGGFASLLAIPIGPIRDFGINAAMGILISFFVSLTAIPALVLILKPRTKQRDTGGAEESSLRLLKKANSRPAFLVAASVIILALCASGFIHLSFETNLKNFFPEEHPVNDGTAALQRMFNASNAVDFIVERRDGRPLSGEDFRTLAAFRDWIRGKQDVVYSQGILAAGRFVSGGEEQFIRTMNSPFAPALRAAFNANPLLSRYLSADGTLARLTLMAQDDSAEKGIEIGSFINAEAGDVLGDLQVYPSGQSILFAGMSRKLFQGQVNSVAVILLFVTILITLALRSPGLGLISLVPNAAPIFITLGIMGWLQIPLNVITVMVSSVAIGIAVDDTIHFLYYYRSRRNGGHTVTEAVMETLEAKGKPIFYTSFVLTGAFLTHILSTFKPTQYLGILSAFTMLGALAGDLFFLPGLLQVVRRKNGKK